MSRKASTPDPVGDAVVAAVPYLEILQELKRELHMRERLYPNWIETGKMKGDVAQRQIIRLEAAILQIDKLWRAEGAPTADGQVNLGL